MATIGGSLVCLVILGLDLAAAILGIQAEVKLMELWQSECREPSQGAFRQGLAAATILVIAHVLISLIGGCLCICSEDEFQKSSSAKKMSMACLVLTWIVFAIGFIALVIGTMSSTSCGFTHHHYLSIGGIVCFLHAVFCVAYYVSATAAKDEAAKDEAAKDEAAK